MKQSPNVSKNSKRSQQRQKQQMQIVQDQPPHAPIPDPSANDYGTTDAVIRLLEVKDLYFSHGAPALADKACQMAETMSLLGPLCQFSQQNSNLSASEALRIYTTQQPQQSQYPQILPQHPNHPLNNANFHHPQPNQFVSPAAPHLALPMNVQSNSTSPKTLQNFSPAMQHQMITQLHGTPQQSNQHLGQGPTSAAMMNQQSQQGTNTSGGGSRGTSANASPNVTNKRRRSAVKLEGDEPEVNGTGPAGPNKVKASPRVGVKRQKGNG